MSQPSPPNKKRKREKVNREEESTKAFCQSIFSDLLHLEPKQQMTCKIDIMCLIQKYRMGGDSIIKEPFRSEAAEAIVSIPFLLYKITAPSHLYAFELSLQLIFIVEISDIIRR